MKEQLLDRAVHSPAAEQVSSIIGEVWWLFLVLVAVMIFRETIKNLVTSIMVLRSGDYRVDSIVILEGVQARIVRMGITKTTFYLYRENAEGEMFFTRRIVMNQELPDLHIEVPQEGMDNVIPKGFRGAM